MLVYHKNFKITCLINYADMVLLIHKKGKVKKWRHREYHVQKTKDVEHQYVKRYCTKIYFHPLSFCGLHKKTIVERVLGNNYNMHFDTKLGHVTCEIRCILCACTQCIPMLDETCYTGVKTQQQPLYKPVKYWTQWPVLGYLNNWNIFQFSHKRHLVNRLKNNQVELGGISDSMDVLVQKGKYGAINTTDTTKIECYVINFLSEAYTFQEDTICDGQISTSGKIIVKVNYKNCMQDKTKWYWEQKKQKNSIIFLTLTIVHTCLDVL